MYIAIKTIRNGQTHSSILEKPAILEQSFSLDSVKPLERSSS